jgi:hypothetical protein
MNKGSLQSRAGLLALLVTLVLVTLALVGRGLALAAPAAAGVVVNPHTAAKSGLRGSIVTYTLRITNTGDAPDLYTTGVSSSAWPTNVLCDLPCTVLLPSAGRTYTIEVLIPSDATGFDVVTFTARSGNNNAVFDTSRMTTSVFFRLYLPIVYK